MKQEELTQVKALIANINTYSHLFKGINLSKEIKSFEISMYYEDTHNIERSLNKITFTDYSVKSFDTYENMLNYLKGMSDFVDMIKKEKDNND